MIHDFCTILALYAIFQKIFLAENYEVFLRGGEDKIYTWREAKNYCQRFIYKTRLD